MNKKISLPNPELNLNFPLMKAFEQRRSKRKWSDQKLSLQQISNILWSACGETKKAKSNAKNRRTAPSAKNSQEISIYITMEEGVFLYNEQKHELIKHLNSNIISYIGTQKMMQNAPLGIIFISDYNKISNFAKTEEKKLFISGTDTGFISQNIYLYCAAANLNTVVLGLVNRENLHNILQLETHQKVMYTQVIGIPKS